jgi:hypothetical protein
MALRIALHRRSAGRAQAGEGFQHRNDARDRAPGPRSVDGAARGAESARRRLSARARRIALSASDKPWYRIEDEQTISLCDVDAVLMRQDPPFDFEYITATWMLERAVAGGARVFNHPRAIRDHSEKVSICEFPDLITPTLVSRDVASVNAFIDSSRRLHPETARQHGRRAHLPRPPR